MAWYNSMGQEDFTGWFWCSCFFHARDGKREESKRNRGKKRRENVMNFYLFFILLVSKQCSANLWRTVHTLKKFQQNEEADGGVLFFFSSLLHQKVILVRLL
jgi:hypothetical protein